MTPSRILCDLRQHEDVEPTRDDRFAATQSEIAMLRRSHQFPRRI
jgi:hypothetical protein